MIKLDAGVLAKFLPLQPCPLPLQACHATQLSKSISQQCRHRCVKQLQVQGVMMQDCIINSLCVSQVSKQAAAACVSLNAKVQTIFALLDIAYLLPCKMTLACE